MKNNKKKSLKTVKNFGQMKSYFTLTSISLNFFGDFPSKKLPFGDPGCVRQSDNSKHASIAELFYP